MDRTMHEILAKLDAAAKRCRRLANDGTLTLSGARGYIGRAEGYEHAAQMIREALDDECVVQTLWGPVPLEMGNPVG